MLCVGINDSRGAPVENGTMGGRSLVGGPEMVYAPGGGLLGGGTGERDERSNIFGLDRNEVYFQRSISGK